MRPTHGSNVTFSAGCSMNRISQILPTCRPPRHRPDDGRFCPAVLAQFWQSVLDSRRDAVGHRNASEVRPSPGTPLASRFTYGRLRRGRAAGPSARPPTDVRSRADGSQLSGFIACSSATPTRHSNWGVVKSGYRQSDCERRDVDAGCCRSLAIG